MSPAPAAPEHRPRPDQFGGPWGALALTVLMPTISFYLWSAVAQHGGSLWLPKSLAELAAMVPTPTWDAAVIFAGWLVLQALLYAFAPGRVVMGRPTEHGEQAEYRINGLFAFVVSAGLLVGGIALGWVSPQGVLAQWGPLLTLAIAFSIVAAAMCQVAGVRRAHLERSTGHWIYDFYMGAMLNPKLGRYDLKFFFESRMGMATWG
ncbi:MAG: hypothetical protein IAG13_18740, partial [Deltaproteobacteria bacterium]|nr:hypothetical protein [Nannocystaceae bacterium]